MLLQTLMFSMLGQQEANLHLCRIQTTPQGSCFFTVPKHGDGNVPGMQLKGAAITHHTQARQVSLSLQVLQVSTRDCAAAGGAVKGPPDPDFVT